jgi:hypothetical protein
MTITFASIGSPSGPPPRNDRSCLPAQAHRRTGAQACRSTTSRSALRIANKFYLTTRWPRRLLGRQTGKGARTGALLARHELLPSVPARRRPRRPARHRGRVAQQPTQQQPTQQQPCLAARQPWQQPWQQLALAAPPPAPRPHPNSPVRLRQRQAGRLRGQPQQAAATGSRHRRSKVTASAGAAAAAAGSSRSCTGAAAPPQAGKRSSESSSESSSAAAAQQQQREQQRSSSAAAAAQQQQRSSSCQQP